MKATGVTVELAVGDSSTYPVYRDSETHTWRSGIDNDGYLILGLMPNDGGLDAKESVVFAPDKWVYAHQVMGVDE